MTKSKPNPGLLKNQMRFLAGFLLTPMAFFSITVIFAFSPHPFLALFPLPTLLLGTGMIALELRIRLAE